jgi:hypothetical protein
MSAKDEMQDEEQMEMSEDQEAQEIGQEDVGELSPIVIPADTMLEMEASLKEEPIDVAALRADRVGPKIEAKDLVGQTFTIPYARQFPTAYQEQTHNPWFVIAIDENGERFNTVLGGRAIHEELTSWAMLRTRAPLKVKLLFHEKKGRYEGYYTFE